MKPVFSYAVALVLMIGGVHVAMAGSGGESNELPQPRIEHVCGTSLQFETFEIDVLSNGCTKEEDFIFIVERAGPREFDVQVIRVVPDICYGPSRTVTLSFDRESLGLDGVDVVNLQNPMCGYCPDRW